MEVRDVGYNMESPTPILFLVVHSCELKVSALRSSCDALVRNINEPVL